MKTLCSNQRNRAITFAEFIVIIGVIVLVVALLVALPRRRPAQQISCSNNLKQIGLAYKIWAGDYNDNFPMAVSTNFGGTMELMNTPDAWRVFQVISNELSDPRVLFCPDDSSHQPFTYHPPNLPGFGDDLKAHISYFIGMDATPTNPTGLLSGDGNFTFNNSSANHGYLNVTNNKALAWDTSRLFTTSKRGLISKTKTGWGNILLADGSVYLTSTAENTNHVENSTDCYTSSLSDILANTGLATNRLVIP